MKYSKVFLFIVLLLSMCNCNLMASETSIRQYIDNHKGSLHPVEGIWQSTDGYKYGITYYGYRNGAKSYSMEILSSPHKVFSVGSCKGYISDGSNKGIYSLEYNVKEWYENAYGQVTQITKSYQENLILVAETSSLMKFTRLDGKEIAMYKLYPTGDNNQSPSHTTSTKWSGTGFFLSKNGYIITNHHVIDGAKTIKVTSINGNHNTSYNARIEVSDKQNDLAIIKITDYFTAPSIPYTFKFLQSNIGENCWVLGYPLTQTMGEDIKLTNGIISSKSGFDGNIAQYQFSAPIQPGNSGGPVFDNNGNLIGVVQAKHGAAENAGYAVKASYVRNLIDMLPTSITLPQTNQLAGKTLPQQVELASKCVVLIICE